MLAIVVNGGRMARGKLSGRWLDDDHQANGWLVELKHGLRAED